MSLDEVVVLRVSKRQKQLLESIALENGVNSSALCRNTIALCLMPIEEPLQLERIISRIKREREELLYQGNKRPRRKRARDNGSEENTSSS